MKRRLTALAITAATLVAEQRALQGQVGDLSDTVSEFARLAENHRQASAEWVAGVDAAAAERGVDLPDWPDKHTP